jgi:hypothetical protein
MLLVLQDCAGEGGERLSATVNPPNQHDKESHLQFSLSDNHANRLASSSSYSMYCADTIIVSQPPSLQIEPFGSSRMQTDMRNWHWQMWPHRTVGGGPTSVQNANTPIDIACIHPRNFKRLSLGRSLFTFPGYSHYKHGRCMLGKQYVRHAPHDRSY